MVKKVCQEANVKGKKTNHSLRATSATQMFREGAPEKIQERTGHRPLEGLQSYERSSESQHRALSTLLSSNKKVTEKGSSHSFTQSNKATVENNSTSILSMNFKDCNVTVTIQGSSDARSSSLSEGFSPYFSCVAILASICMVIRRLCHLQDILLATCTLLLLNILGHLHQSLWTLIVIKKTLLHNTFSYDYQSISFCLSQYSDIMTL